MTRGSVCAVVGAVGGAGATRLSLEFAATLARDGRSVAVVDAAYETQGLATAVPGRIGTDVTAVVTADGPLAAATTRLDLDLPGGVSVAPALAPFERLSRAKTSECGRRLAERLSRAAGEYDHVLVDVPPVAANQAVAAVTAADRVCLVVPDDGRGADALPRLRDRVRDVDAGVDAVVANRADGTPRIDDADAAVPASGVSALADAPVCVASGEFADAVAATVETVLGCDLDLGGSEESSSLTDGLLG